MTASHGVHTEQTKKTYSLYQVGSCNCKATRCRFTRCSCRKDERMCDDKCNCLGCCNIEDYRESTDPVYLKERYPHAFNDSIRYH